MTRQEYLIGKGFNIEGLLRPDDDIDADFVGCVGNLLDALEDFELKYIENSDTYIS